MGKPIIVHITFFALSKNVAAKLRSPSNVYFMTNSSGHEFKILTYLLTIVAKEKKGGGGEEKKGVCGETGRKIK